MGGALLGAALSIPAGRAFASLLFRESSSDTEVLAIVAGTLSAVTLLASAVPAFRAARSDPSVALRSE